MRAGPRPVAFLEIPLANLTHPGATWMYEDPDLPGVVWTFGALSKREKALVLDESFATDGETTTTRIGSYNYWHVFLSVRGVKGAPFEDAFATEAHPLGSRLHPVPTEAFLDTIPDVVFARMASEVAARNSVSVEQVGES